VLFSVLKKHRAFIFHGLCVQGMHARVVLRSDKHHLSDKIRVMYHTHKTEQNMWKDSGPLGCNTFQSGRQVPVFWKDLLPPSSG
jgi:hypothetical protein